MSDIARTAAAILRLKDRELSSAFREQVAKMIEALDQCHIEMQMTEQAHLRANHPYYSRALELTKEAFCQELTNVPDKGQEALRAADELARTAREVSTASRNGSPEQHADMRKALAAYREARS